MVLSGTCYLCLVFLCTEIIFHVVLFNYYFPAAQIGTAGLSNRVCPVLCLYVCLSICLQRVLKIVPCGLCMRNVYECGGAYPFTICYQALQCNVHNRSQFVSSHLYSNPMSSHL